ncbi:disulfide bond formation protein DsbA [Cereibacter changlensis JA139]|uniref:Disulfide bond formation protein DsbA n=2 Tax=Cereibacter changlensis TaxID=402884 RepID=A0A2T4K008_9RHOB|nr:DsbA family protein [Cereibacter changlensis]PTE23488.1 disulfide bond formation protein DsbA [Cereibacter changlensis JA139]PZX52996.1 protein-disulfide isomerase [Cereibacter changlensis]
MKFPALGPAALIAALLATTAPLAAQEMTDAERTAFRAEVRAYLVENPEVLIEAMTALEAKQQAEQANNDLTLLRDNSEEIFRDPASWAGGNLEGDITLVEFVDYRCGYCRKAHDEVAELVQSDGNIRFVLKEYPILGEESLVASRFAIAVRQLAGDEAYKQAHDTLIAFRGDINTDTLGRLASDMGLDSAAILARMDAPEVTAVIEANHALATKLDVSGTPTFVLDRTMVRGYVPLDGMRQIVEGQRAG